MTAASNCLAPQKWIARDILARFKPDALVMTNELGNGDISVSVGWNGNTCGFSVTLQQRTWSMDEIMEKVMRPHLNGLLDGNT